MKVWVVVSLIRSAAAGAAPLPCSTIVTGSSSALSLKFGALLAQPEQRFQEFGPLSGGLGGNFNRFGPGGPYRRSGGRSGRQGPMLRGNPSSSEVRHGQSLLQHRVPRAGRGGLENHS